jgi:hypothetical protein
MEQKVRTWWATLTGRVDKRGFWLALKLRSPSKNSIFSVMARSGPYEIGVNELPGVKILNY